MDRESNCGIPAYSWHGAGSEKGGSSEYIKYEQIVFLPEKDGKIQVVSVGKKHLSGYNFILICDDFGEIIGTYGPNLRDYSALLRCAITPDLADRMLAVEDKNSSSFKSALDKILEFATNHFKCVPLLAFDSEDSSGCFGFNEYGHFESLKECKILHNSFWNWKLSGDLRQRVSLSRCITEYVKGNECDSDFMDRGLDYTRRYNDTTFGKLKENRVINYLE